MSPTTCDASDAPHAMMLRGKPVADALMAAAKIRVQALRDRGVEAKLAVVRVGEDPSDAAYLRGIARRAEEAGLSVELVKLADSIPQGELERLVEDLSDDPCVHGVLILRPLPAPLDEKRLASLLSPAKDVDGMTEANLARVFAGDPLGFAPATARAVTELLKHYGYDVRGRHACVIGRSLVSGRPIQGLLTARDATVTLCHSKTRDLASHARRAELLVAAVGEAGFVTPQMVGEGAWVVDVGINEAPAGDGVRTMGIVGDVAPEAAEVAEALTPVPGGLGAVTSAVLVLQAVEAAERQTR